MILLISSPSDPNIRNVIKVLDESDMPWLRLNGTDLLQKLNFDISISNICETSTMLRRRLESENLFPMDKITAVWSRGIGSISVDPALAPEVQNFVASEIKTVVEALEFLIPQARWMNPIWSDFIAQNPIKQLLAAKQAGLTIPETLITQSAVAAKKFVANHKNKVIIKMLSNINPASLGFQKFFLTNRWNDISEKYLDNIQYCPTLLQAEIDRLTEIRVTVVGKHFFAAAIAPDSIQSIGVDVREGDLTTLPHAEYKLPLHIQRRIKQMMKLLSLQFCSMDLMKTHNGEYVFLDLNPCGQYGWTETLTGMPINRTIANWLVNADNSTGFIQERK
jgi:hypothetical protein